MAEAVSMTMHPTRDEVLATLRRVGLVPVIIIEEPANAAPLAAALTEGGVPVAEITFRTPRAPHALELIAREYPDMMVGAGTILTRAQAIDARAAGAKFIVTPGFGSEVVEYCVEEGIPIFPGIATATEIQLALTYGVRCLKIFPVEQLGGVAYLNTVSGPFPGLEFIATGGITPESLASYYTSPKVVACGSSWIAAPDLIAGGHFGRITENAGAAVESKRAVRA